MPSPALEFALVRILRILIDDQDPRRPVGAGFLVTPQHIITCAHVVNDALGQNKYTAEPPADEIFLDFPLLNNRPLLRAKILHWFSVQENSSVAEIEDVAVLQLLPDIPLPAEAQPAPLVLPHEQSFFEQRVRMCGFPVGADNGTYANGILQGPNGKGWIEIHHQGSELVEGGFSGTAVWAVGENAVCGMTVSVLNRRNAVVAYMIPAALLINAFPDLDEHSRPANPYRGLEAFREKDAKLYFGREQTITRQQQVIADQPFAAVIGASGSGKSSVVFAGLVPALRQSGDWLIAHCRPKNQPLYELAACLIPLLYDDPILRSEKIDELREKMHAGSVGLTGIIRQIREKYEGQYFLLIVDQFEELFTLNPDTKLIRHYIDLLLECLHSEQFTVLSTMRADFFAAAVSHPALAQALDSYAPIILPQLDEQGLREVVEQPAKSLSVRFTDGLVDLIIRDVGQEPGSLPLLEFCLTQLWERQEFREINHDAYKAIGGVQQALANHADAVYGKFDEEEREQLRHIFLKLVRPGQGTEDTRQVASVGQIAKEYRGLITRLADKRLLVTGRDEERGEETVEVVHEALIRRWQTLRQWVDEEREFLVWQEKLRVLLGQWEESGKDEGALLRGLPLDEALKWRESHDVHLADGEREFIGASGQLRKKEQQAKKKRGQYLVIGLVGAVILAVLAGVFGLKARQQQVIAEQNAVEAEKEKYRAEQQTLAANYNLAKAFEEKALTALKVAKEKGDIGKYKEAILFTSVAMDQSTENNKNTLAPSSIINFFLSSNIFDAALSERWSSPKQTEDIKSISFHPMGTLLAATAGKNIQLWDCISGKETIVLEGHTDLVTSIAFSPDGKTLASTSHDETVRIWNYATGEELMVLQVHTNSTRRDPDSFSTKPDGRVIFNPDGVHVASSSIDDSMMLWNIESGELVKNFSWYYRLYDIAFSPDGQVLALVRSGGFMKHIIELWDYNTGSPIDETIVSHPPDNGTYRIEYPGSISFSSVGGLFAVTSNQTILLWNFLTGKQIDLQHTAEVKDISFIPDGTLLASASDDSTIRILDSNTGQELKILRGHSNSVTSLSFTSDGKQLASASSDRTIRVWDPIIPQTTVLEGHTKMITSISFSPDGKRIASSSLDKTVRLWNAQTGKEIMVLEGHNDEVIRVIFSPDGKLLASSSGTIFLWDAETGEKLYELEGHAAMTVLSFSPDSKTLYSASFRSDNDTIKVWDIEKKEEIVKFRERTDGIFNMSLSPNGNMMALASVDNSIRLRDVKKWIELKKIKGNSELVANVFSPNGKFLAFSPDGKFLATAESENFWSSSSKEVGNTIWLRDANSLKKIKSLNGHEKTIISISFTPDSNFLASASFDKSVRIWDVNTGKELIALPHTEEVLGVSFSPDGKRMASVLIGKTIIVWNIEPYVHFLTNSKPTPLYHTFIEAVKFLWQLDVQGLEIVETKRRTPADLEKYGTLLAPPPPGQSKFDQVLEWAEKQQVR